MRLHTEKTLTAPINMDQREVFWKATVELLKSWKLQGKDLGETNILSTEKEDLSLSFTIQNKLT